MMIDAPVVDRSKSARSPRMARPQAKLKTNVCVLRRVIAAGDKRGTRLMRMPISRQVPVAELFGHPVYEHSARRQLPHMGVEDVDKAAATAEPSKRRGRRDSSRSSTCPSVSVRSGRYDPTEDVANVGFTVLDRLRREMLHRGGLSDLLKPSVLI
jgi:hypothetical protein